MQLTFGKWISHFGLQLQNYMGIISEMQAPGAEADFEVWVGASLCTLISLQLSRKPGSSFKR